MWTHENSCPQQEELQEVRVFGCQSNNLEQPGVKLELEAGTALCTQNLTIIQISSKHGECVMWFNNTVVRTSRVQLYWLLKGNPATYLIKKHYTYINLVMLLRYTPTCLLLNIISIGAIPSRLLLNTVMWQMMDNNNGCLVVLALATV